MALPSPASARSPEPGDVIAGKYIVERVIGRGGMGVVYEVTHRFTRKRLALKCLLPEHLGDQDTVERFVRESQAAGRIQHRHVADIFDVGRDGSVLYMVLPLFEGKPLSELFKERALSTDDVLVILMRALEGVAAAHAQGVLHRDLKPDNIFVCLGPSGRIDDPRVLDFGISKFEDDVSQPLTRSGISMGTPYYMSLEQISGHRDLDQRVDVYAMGVLLYEGLSGERPYTAETVGGLAVTMVTSPAVPLYERKPELPRALCEAVMRAISIERVTRTPSIAALMEDLKPFVLEAELAILQGAKNRSTPPPTSASEQPELLVTARIEVGTEATVPLPHIKTPLSAPVPLVTPKAKSTKPFVRVGLFAAASLLLIAGAFAGLQGFASPPKTSKQATLTVGKPTVPKSEERHVGTARPVEPEPIIEQMKEEEPSEEATVWPSEVETSDLEATEGKLRRARRRDRENANEVTPAEPSTEAQAAAASPPESGGQAKDTDVKSAGAPEAKAEPSKAVTELSQPAVESPSKAQEPKVEAAAEEAPAAASAPSAAPVQ